MGKEKEKEKESPLCHPLRCVGLVAKQDTLQAIALLIGFQLLMVMINFGMMTLRTGPIGPNGRSTL